MPIMSQSEWVAPSQSDSLPINSRTENGTRVRMPSLLMTTD